MTRPGHWPGGLRWPTLWNVRAEDIDDVVQALAVAKYALEAHDEPAAGEAIDTALAKARALLSRATDERFVRSRPAS
jgi:hypothetical protein